MSLTVEPLERAKARWRLLLAVEDLGADGPLGALRELLPRGPWPEPGRGVHCAIPCWALDDEVAALPPKTARVLAKALKKGLLLELPTDMSPLQAALLVRWSVRSHLIAAWCMQQAALTLWTWERHPELAEDPLSWGGLVPAAYFPGTREDDRRLLIEWDYALEPRRAAEKRIADEVKRWLDSLEEAARRSGWHDAPKRRVRASERPPGWEFAAFAKYQCACVSQRRLAADLGLTRQALKSALERAADVLELPLRPPGR